MSSAMGTLKWTPDVFWRATFYEYTAAMKGHLASLGVDVEPPVTRDEFLSMKAAEEARTKTNEMPDA